MAELLAEIPLATQHSDQHRKMLCTAAQGN